MDGGSNLQPTYMIKTHLQPTYMIVRAAERAWLKPSSVITDISLVFVLFYFFVLNTISLCFLFSYMLDWISLVHMLKSFILHLLLFVCLFFRRLLLFCKFDFFFFFFWSLCGHWSEPLILDINSKFVIHKEVLDYDSLQVFNLSLRMNCGFKEFGFDLEVAGCFKCLFGKELWV